LGVAYGRSFLFLVVGALPLAMSLPRAFSNDHGIAGTHCQDVLVDVTTSPCLIPKVEQSSILRQETRQQRK
jgi:hypothetical protein